MRAKARPAPVLRALRAAPGSFARNAVNQPSRLGLLASGLAQAIGVRGEGSATSFAGGATPPPVRPFGSALFRLNLQAAHDLSRAESEKDYSRVHSRADARPELSRVDKIWRL